MSVPRRIHEHGGTVLVLCIDVGLCLDQVQDGLQFAVRTCSAEFCAEFALVGSLLACLLQSVVVNKQMHSTTVNS